VISEVGAPQQRQFRWRWPRSIESLLDTTSAHSWAITSPPGSFELPMQTW
jgi:hypothetical protein